MKNSQYVPYVLGTPRHANHSQGQNAVILLGDGTVETKKLSVSHTDEYSITFTEWINVASALKPVYRKWHSAGGRAAGFAAHHKVVQGLAGTHSWPIALKYNICQRMSAERFPQVDISQLNTDKLTIITTDPAYSTFPVLYANPTTK